MQRLMLQWTRNAQTIRPIDGQEKISGKELRMHRDIEKRESER